MNKLLITIPMHADDAPRAEALCDWIYQLNGRTPLGHVFLAYAHDVHEEMKMRLRISAELAFETVTEATPIAAPEMPGRFGAINHLFIQVAKQISRFSKFPWLWLEPDSVPLERGWQRLIFDAYENQPKLYFGSFLAFKVKEQDKRCLSRMAIYPNSATGDLVSFCNQKEIGFNVPAGEFIVPRSKKTLLFQQLHVVDETSLPKIRPDAVLLHGDKFNQVIPMLREKLNQKPEIVSNFVEKLEDMGVHFPAPKVDGRTKAGRAAKAAQEKA